MNKWLPLMVLSLIASLINSSAITLTLESVPHQRVFDVIWGPSAPADLNGPEATASIIDVSSIIASDAGSRVTISYYQFSGVASWFTGGLSFDFPSDTARGFVMPTAIPAGFFFGGLLEIPTSVTPIAGGYGAHVVYDYLAPVPDGGTGASLLALAMAACVALTRRSGWRS